MEKEMGGIAALSFEDHTKIAMGHPSMTRYPQPYPGYPIPYQDHYAQSYPKSYAPPSPPAYYNRKSYHPIEPDQESGTTFLRYIFLMMIIIIICLCAISLVIWLLFGADIPEFRVASLYVPTFDISNSTLKADWVMNVTVINPNEKLEIHFNNVESSIFYDNNVLAMASEDPFHVGVDSQTTMQLKLSTRKMDPSQTLKDRVVEKMANDRSDGTMTFCLRMALNAKSKYGSLMRLQRFKLFCDGLVVRFDGDMGPGILASGMENDCLLFT
ncbi:hypothetical protein RJ639_028303 [Escallonia herrerae]|uniref:Late embryogenesis abundant protein LEA-2 subgroup domain-containing protein n=1 Tax=Escallonia herrerae TaxID=1293975 RepID=A0AA89BE19_9ASTE|nr:hypothetical protein RJ639_028303 [Escallonia herrerae]